MGYFSATIGGPPPVLLLLRLKSLQCCSNLQHTKTNLNRRNILSALKQKSPRSPQVIPD